MRSPAALAVAATLALLPSTAWAADPLREPWAGFQPGSFVHQRTTMRSSLPGSRESVTESRTTLVKVEKDVLTLRSEFRVAGGAWRGQDIRMDPTAPSAVEAGKAEDLGEETLVVDGRSLVCRKRRTVVDGTTTVSWTHPDYGLVRSESSGSGESRTRTSLEKLSTKARAGAQDVDCRQVVTATTTTVGTSTTTMWVSPAVPGGVVRSETLTVQGSTRLTMVTETLEQEAKR